MQVHLPDTRPMKAAANYKHVFIAWQLCAELSGWSFHRIERVAGSDKLACTPVPFPLEQHRLSSA